MTRAWYRESLASATEHLAARPSTGADAIRAAADAVRDRLRTGDAEFGQPRHVVAKPGPWWLDSATDEWPERLVLFQDGEPAELDIGTYHDVLDGDPDCDILPKYRLFASTEQQDNLLDLTLFTLLQKAPATQFRSLHQRAAVRNVFQALRHGTYRGVIATDIRAFDKTLDRDAAMERVRRILDGSDLPVVARQAVARALESLGCRSEEVLTVVDRDHRPNRGVLSGYRLTNWLRDMLAAEMARHWSRRGYRVFSSGDDFLVLARRPLAAEDYAGLAQDVQERLGQDLHPLEPQEDPGTAMDRSAAPIGTRPTTKASLPDTPSAHRPLVGDVRDGFRFVGFEFQVVGERSAPDGKNGVRARISQATHKRILWSIKRATRTSSSIGDPSRLAKAAERLRSLLGTTNGDRVGKAGHLLRCWFNREIQLQARSFDKLLRRRLVYLFGGDSRVDPSRLPELDALVSLLAERTGIRIHTFGSLFRACQEKARVMSRGRAREPHPTGS